MGIRRRRGIGIGYSDSLSSIWTILVWVGLLGGVGFGIFYAVGKVQTHAQGEIASTPRNVLDGKPRRLAGNAKPAVPPPAARQPQIDQIAGDLNIAVLAREAARYRGERAQEERFRGEANDARKRLAEVAGASGAVPEHLDPADEVVGFQDVDLAKMEAAAAGEHLARAAKSVPVNSQVKVRVKRYGQLKDLYLFFSKAGGADIAAAGSGPVAISNDFAREIQNTVLSLPPEQLRKDERKRIEVILGEGQASREDYAWLVRRMAKDDAGYLFDERQELEESIGRLQVLLPTVKIPDAVLTKEGHRISGTILSETLSGTTIQTVIMPVSIKVEDIRFKWSAQDLREEFDRKLKTASNQTEAFPQLLLWCRDWNMPVHRELAAYHRLLIERNDRTARLAAGFVSSGEGRWVQKGSIAQSGTAPQILKRPETRGDMLPLLEQFGYRLHKDKWFRHLQWSAGFHTLHQPGGITMRPQGLNVLSWFEWDTPLNRLKNPTGKPANPNDQPTLRFFAPAAGAGSVALTVEAPHDILDAQLRAVGTVVEAGHGAKVEARLDVGFGAASLLYSLSEGANDDYHDISKRVEGRRRFTVIATVTASKDRYAYGRFLSSIPTSKETFWVRGTVLEPAPEVDKLWQAARP